MEKYQNKTFEDLKNEIFEKIKEKMGDGPSNYFGEDVTIIPSFSYIDFQNKLDGNYYMNGQRMPAVVLVGRNTGRVWMFSVGELLT
jgi:hypothetical protein